jgi:hypothetical protein
LTSWQTVLLWAIPPVFLAACLIGMVVSQRSPVLWFYLFQVHQQRPPRQRLEHFMLSLGCAFPLTMALAWQLRLWQTLSVELSDRNGIATLLHGGVIASLLLAAVIGIAMTMAAALRVVEATDTRRRMPVAELTSLMGVALALGTGFFFGKYLTDQSIWSGTSGVFHVERTMALSSLISPAPAIAGLLALGYGWAFWGLRSLHHHVIDAGNKPNVIRVLEGRRPNVPSALALAAGSTVHPAGGFLLVPVLVVPGAFLLVVPQTHSVDGAALGWMLSIGSMLGLVALSIELGQAAWLGHRTKDALEHLRGHALGPVIGDLGSEQADWGMSLEPRHGKTRRLLKEKLEGLQRRLMAFFRDFEETVVVNTEIPEPDRRHEGSGLPGGDSWHQATARRVEIRSGDISGVASELRVIEPSRPIDDLLDAPRRQALVRTPLWKTAVAVAERLAPPLENRYWRPRREIPAYTVPGRFLKDAERFVAIVMAVIVRTLVVRVVRGLSIAALLGAALLFAHLTYTFPGRRFWLLLDLMALTLVAVVAVRQLLAFERDHILNRLWSSTPGRVGLSSGLLWRAMATSALPLLTLLAVLFPEVGGSLLTWVEPLRHLMPMP